MRVLFFLVAFLIAISSVSAADTNPPLMSSINVVNIGLDKATLIWFTDEPSTSVVQLEGFIANSSQLVTSHSIPLRGLTPGREYFYNVSSCDKLGNCATAAGNALRFTTLPLYLGEEKDISKSDASRLVKASSSKAYLINFGQTNPYTGSFSLRSGFLFSINGSDHGIIVTRIADPSIDLTFVPRTNISLLKINQTRGYDLNNDTLPDIEIYVSGIGKRIAVGDQGIRYIEYYTNLSIRSLHITEEKVAEKTSVNFTESIAPYKLPSGPDKEGKINILSRLLPKEGPSIFLGIVIFLAVLFAGLLILWLVRGQR